MIEYAEKTDEPSAFTVSYEYRFRFAVLSREQLVRESMRIARQSKNPPPCFGLRPDWFLPAKRS